MPSSGLAPFPVDKEPLHKGHFSVGTDGVDLVWTEGTVEPGEEGYNDSLLPFTKTSVMTAPYQLNTTPKGKRLRSDIEGFHSPFAVGCGYAAHINLSLADRQLIVRLSNGVSWEIKGKGPPAPPTKIWSWMPLVGLTCNEVFFGALGRPTELGLLRGTIVKIKLSSLGPGIPPD